MFNNICQLSFEEVFPIWKNKLWPNRTSAIESHSAMLIDRTYDMGNFKLPAWYYGCFVNSALVGVYSGHMCTDGLARLRGHWVDIEFRNKGLGRQLLLYTLNHSKSYGASGTWCYPRLTSWKMYEALGFKLISDWEKSETSEANAYVLIRHTNH